MSWFRDSAAGLTAERLREALAYDPATGEWTWLVSNSMRRLAGSKAGELKPSGYILIGIDCFRYRAHRLAWLYMTGVWPKEQVDHINGERADNRWANLREATQVQNSANMKVRGSNRAGIKGVSRYDGISVTRWRAHLSVGHHMFYLGSYATPEAAHAAYVDAAKRHFGEFARTA